MKKILSIILSSLYLVSLPALVNAQTTVGRPASMYYSPGTSTVTLNSAGEFSASVMVNTGGADSVGADSIVTFDTTKLAFVSGTYPAGTATFFPNNAVVGMPSASSANTSGRISLARVISAPAEGSTPVYTNGSGTFATLTFKPLTGVTSATLSFDFTLGSTTDSNVAGTIAGSDILGSATPATYTFVAYTNGDDTDPYITAIIPEEGDEDTETELIIEGGNFGVEDGKVYIGTRLADIIAWSNDEITVTVPAITVSKDTQYQVKVRRTDGKIATYMGFTIVDTGLAGILWMGLLPLNGAAAILVKRRWFSKRKLEAVSIPIQIIG